MTETKIYSFINLFNDVRKIEIPIIQRDYAQGRDIPDVSRIRKRFLTSIYDALAQKQPLKLDFIYGDVDESGILIPLDGQQRLTTLFLLHWYIARHENVLDEKIDFLKNFSYRTRYSAREFCKRLVAYHPDFSQKKLSEDIADQHWMPLDWRNDPTISAMLNMLDDIHLFFGKTNDLWSQLENGIIGFYFLSIKKMGLTDELYIKMNSRGKPLTEFEHFKAEWENALRKVDGSAAKRIGQKIDLAWTDVFWPYKGRNNIVDEKIVRYFKYISAILYYKKYPEESLPSDVFDILRNIFVEKKDDVIDNLNFIESSFDCWVDVDIGSFFSQFLTQKKHEEGKSLISESINIFEDCCNNYGENKSAWIRKFSIGRMVLLYAFLLYLCNRNILTEQNFRRRLRIVNNMIKASEFELREDRMNALLAQTEEIILEGKIDVLSNRKSFNGLQIKEEKEKQQWIEANPDKTEKLFYLEDHPILNGGMRVVGLENIDLTDNFYSLFACDRALVNQALLAIGDYSLRVNWRYQIGTKKDNPWKAIFHTDGENIQKVKKILVELLQHVNNPDNEYLKKLISEYTNAQKKYDWRYYIIKYEEMRPESYGMYYWYDWKKNGKKSYRILMMMTEKSLSGKNYNIFLKTLYERSSKKNLLRIGEYAYRGDGDRLYFDSLGRYLTCEDSCFNLYITETGDLEKSYAIKQDEDVDCIDRIDLGSKIIEDILK